MPSIHLTTFIAAPIERVFDLSRHIGLHKISQQHNNEEAIAGVTSGLINQGEWVTWKAKHLFKTRIMTVKITEMKSPGYFEGVMEKGDFVSYTHKHHFKEVQNGTIMIDELEFETPYNVFGKLLNRVYLTNYLQQLLHARNKTIKDFAETAKWKSYVGH
ncbi:cell division protein [Lacibacter luteus]|uniref:Cell division protein n=2 Tax=Lacibacter luteus TaxID=2508719 RepID=A0A4Q1CK43_9BACT|nr:cell division protein [Lacibacter luteus]